MKRRRFTWVCDGRVYPDPKRPGHAERVHEVIRVPVPHGVDPFTHKRRCEKCGFNMSIEDRQVLAGVFFR